MATWTKARYAFLRYRLPPSSALLRRVEESRSFDSYGQLSSQEFKVSGSTILRITYERDSLGRITAKNEERASGITRFEYS